MAFVRRRIELTFVLGTGAFGEGPAQTIKIPIDTQQPGTSVKAAPNNTITLNGLRVRAHIHQIGNSSLGTADLMVWGLTLDHLNQLSAIEQLAMYQRRNSVIIAAGDDKDGIAVIFEGQLSASWIDLSSQPDSILHVSATAGLFYLIKPAAPFTLPGFSDAATIIDGMVRQMGDGWAVENDGVVKVSVPIATPYYDGTLLDQIKRVASDANIDLVIEQENQKVIITPRGVPRGGLIPVISPETGLVGYPVHDATGVICTTLFNRSIRVHGKVKVDKSQLIQANGEWYVIDIVHDLESEVHNGEWYTRFQATTLGNANAKPTFT